MVIQIRDDRHMRALTGLSIEQFNQLLPTFSQVYKEVEWETYEEGVARGERQRKPGGGAKGKLAEMEDKLLFVLYYYKIYPTFDAFGTQFDLARQKLIAIYTNFLLARISPGISSKSDSFWGCSKSFQFMPVPRSGYKPGDQTMLLT